MGYESIVDGNIKLTKDAYDKLLLMEIDGESLSEIFEAVSFEEGTMTIYSSGKHYSLEEVLTAIASIKDIDTIDVVEYSGEEMWDMGIYTVAIGGWEYFEARTYLMPVIDSVINNKQKFLAFLTMRKLGGDDAVDWDTFLNAQLSN